MITSPNFDHGTLTIAINGRIDSIKAQMMLDEINVAINTHRNEITEIVLDAENMNFISSLGLRCCLALKKEWDEMRIINCCKEVYGAFKMTGFTRIINITKTLPRIPDEELLPAEGFERAYRLTSDTMVKVFPKGTSLEEVQREVKLSREIFIGGVPTTMSFDIVRVKDGYGIICENVERKPIDATTLSKVLRDFHQHIVEPDGKIPSAIVREKQRVKDKTAEYGSERVTNMLRVLSTIPEGSALIHGNLTMHDIAFSQGGTTPVLINLDSIAYGNPLLDITHLYASMPQNMQTEYFDTFLRAYYCNESASSIEQIKQNIITLAKAYRYFEEGSAEDWGELLFSLHFKTDFAEKIRELERERFYLDNDISIDWVAKALGTNRHYVSDYFNKVLCTTFNDYVNNLRLEHAARLLRDGKVKPSNVPFSAGFNSDHTFRRLFKQKYGCTPSQY